MVQAVESTSSSSSSSTAQLLRSARSLHQLRCALMEEDEEFILNSDLLNPTHIANVVPKEARAEMNLIKDEMYNGSIARTLKAALARGGPRTTSSGLFDFEQLEIEPLQSALVSARSRPFAPCVEVSVTRVLRVLRMLRRLLVLCYWSHICSQFCSQFCLHMYARALTVFVVCFRYRAWW